MDIQKEREAFESAMQELSGGQAKNDVNPVTGEYQYGVMQVMWSVWQKAQAVPEGFVLVKKTKLMQIIGSAAIIEPITRGNPLMSKYKTELDFILSTVRAMIEAQEQK